MTRQLQLGTLAGALLMFCSGCSGTMNQIMSSWNGSHIDQVISRWGYPDEVKDLGGRRLFLWYQNKAYYMPQSSTTTGQVYGSSYYGHTTTTGGYTMQATCTRILEVDKNGYVVGWQWKGNDCPVLSDWSNWAKK